mgnify:CR=1 FL=1
MLNAEFVHTHRELVRSGLDLPVGLHLVGHHFAEQVILNCAYAYQQDTDWHTRCPEAFE